jgi:hypothetical protein
MAFPELIQGVPATVTYTLISGITGFVLLFLATYMVPRIIDRLTPAIDDQAEMIRGNLAVATYVGQVTQAVIVGVSIVIAAAIIAGGL